MCQTEGATCSFKSFVYKFCDSYLLSTSASYFLGRTLGAQLKMVVSKINLSRCVDLEPIYGPYELQ